MSEDKKKFDSLLNEFNKITPPAELVQRWVHLQAPRPQASTGRFRFAAGLAAGIAIGVLFGAVIFQRPSSRLAAEPEYSATFASVTVKYQSETYGGDQ